VVEFQQTVALREVALQKAITAHEAEVEKVVIAHATRERELKDAVAAHATREHELKDAVAAHATREHELKDAIAARQVEFQEVVAARQVEFREVVAAREVEFQEVVAAREVEFQEVVAAREVDFKDAVALHAVREVELEEAVAAQDRREADFSANSAHEIELCRQHKVEMAAEADQLTTAKNIYTGRESSLQTQVTTLSKKIKSAEKTYTTKRCEMEYLHQEQLESIAKTYRDQEQTHRTDLQRCRQELETRFQEELQTRNQEFKTALVQRCTVRENKLRRLIEIEHTGRVEVELESKRSKVWNFTSVRTARPNKELIPCID
jgi:hypothetical protein